MNATPRVGVIGTGALGKEHARIYAELATAGLADFVGIFELDAELAARIADKYGVRAFPDLESLAESCDAVSIVTPTVTHHEIGLKFLRNGKHVLVEKPIAETGQQASELIQMAQEKNLLLQVGHVERFNPVFKYLQHVATEPRFIEAHRLSQFPARSTDIGVVLDLMIHDLDVILAFVNSPVASVEAVGLPVLSASEDIANARIRFENGCVANLTASRVSTDRVRKIRVFSAAPATSYLSLDYREQEGFIYRIAREGEEETSIFKKLIAPKDATIVNEFAGKRIVREPVPLEKEEPLKLELQSFLACIRAREAPVVTGESAKRALDLALEITRQIAGSA